MRSAEGEAGTLRFSGQLSLQGPRSSCSSRRPWRASERGTCSLPRPSAKDEAAWVEPTGSGQAKGLGGAAGGPDGASQAEPAWGGLGPVPGRDKAGHQLQEPRPAKGEDTETVPTWAIIFSDSRSSTALPPPFPRLSSSALLFVH